MPHPKIIQCLACHKHVENHLVGDIGQHTDGVFDCPCDCTIVCARVVDSETYFVEPMDLVLTPKKIQQLKNKPPNITEEDRK